MNLADSQTRFNLMRAFAGESQARNRYDFSACAVEKQQLQGLQRVFQYTAEQEKEHAEVFFNRLRGIGIDNLEITAAYPVDLQTDALSLLKAARHNEGEEHRVIYPDFARVADEEGFGDIAALFRQIAEVERTHEERFQLLALQLEGGTLFKGDMQTVWVCLNCGFIYRGECPPESCPVCAHDRGYFMRAEFAPYTQGK